MNTYQEVEVGFISLVTGRCQVTVDTVNTDKGNFLSLSGNAAVQHRFGWFLQLCEPAFMF